VELGRTNKKINEILEFGPGTVVELDKLVGEALNIYANGKFIAKGEVVVIDDNFGVRVTEIEKNNTKFI
jgi:flagellar motor switch protein FliN/FliY